MDFKNELIDLFRYGDDNLDKFLAKCISDTTIKDLKVGEIYKVEHTTVFRIIYNETDKTFESVIGNREWFYEHFKPLRCINCVDMGMCKAYDNGKEYACYGYQQRKNIHWIYDLLDYRK